MNVLPGMIRQNGYIVRDVDDAVAGWLALGTGPWFVLREMEQPNSNYRGGPSSPVLSIAFANSGELQLELIQVHDDGPSVYREFLGAGRTGFHHLAWWADDFDVVTAQASAAGWPLVQSGDSGGLAHFAYYDLGGAGGTMIEVMELNDLTRAMDERIRGASLEWDGSDPVRPF